ncbi:hypothetical protein F2Q68_00016789 [Brassica cretica]|uniref:Uncharacterized protein n=1 Tax=Brassica cretica TaxID=69181 RepID=A0A8S9HM74_BRACR|nr:hypothetical protein F2Q68_00016789 [Brassica cretica]
MSYSESAYERYNNVRALAARAAGEFPSSNNLRLQKPKRLRNEVGSKESLNLSYSGGSSSSNDDSDRDKTRVGSIQSRRRELRGRDEGRLFDPTRRTGVFDGSFGPTRRTGELNGAFDPSRSFGELDGAFGLDDKA